MSMTYDHRFQRSAVWRHYKGGLYQIACYPARLEHEGTAGSINVVYTSLDLDPTKPADECTWIRPVSDFLAYVEHNGHQVPRFTYVSDTLFQSHTYLGDTKPLPATTTGVDD